MEKNSCDPRTMSQNELLENGIKLETSLANYLKMKANPPQVSGIDSTVYLNYEPMRILIVESAKGPNDFGGLTETSGM